MSENGKSLFRYLLIVAFIVGAFVIANKMLEKTEPEPVPTIQIDDTH